MRVRCAPGLLCGASSWTQVHRYRSEQRRQNKEGDLIGHHRNNEEPYAVPTGRSFDGKGNADDEEQRREHRLKQKKTLRPSRSGIVCPRLLRSFHFEA
jgi:hypothetical protein